MSGDIDGIGAAVTAGLASHAVEPAHGTKGAAQRDRRCLNCGTSLIGAHCHRCGQKTGVHRSFGAIGHDLVHAIFHFEGKIWNTLPLLAWRPGDLTRRYIHGERARFISPLALFLFAVFLTYAVLSLVGIEAQAGVEDRAEVSEVRHRMQGEQAAIDAKLAAPTLADRERKALEEERESLRASETLLNMVDQESAVGNPTDSKAMVTNLRTGVAFIDHGIEKANANPRLVLYKLQANAYKFAWALIPLSLPFMWMLFPFSRRFHSYDHFVFVTYSISFMLLLFVMVRLLNLTAVGGLATFVAVFYVPFHMYRQLRGAYRSSRPAALVRTTLLLFFSLFSVLAFMLLLLALGAMG
jgi:hypothetical protein